MSVATPTSHHRGLSGIRKNYRTQCNPVVFATLFLSGGNMKLTMLATITAIAMLTGCESPAPTMLSIEPIATAKDTTIDAGLIGTWEEPGDHDLIAIVRSSDQGGYQIAVLSGNSVASFQAKLIRVNDMEFLDLAPGDDNDFRLPGHAVMRLWPNGASLRWAFLDSDWLKEQAAALYTHSSDGKMQIFSPAESVRAWIVANGGNDKAYGKVVTWEKAQ